MKRKHVKVVKIHPDAKFEMKRNGDAGYDLYCHSLVQLPPAITVRNLPPLASMGIKEAEPIVYDGTTRRDFPASVPWPGETVDVERNYTIPGTRAMFTKEEAERYWRRKAATLESLSQLVYEPTFQVIKIPTGLLFEIPDGYYGQVLDKSSVGIRGVKSYAGVIDPDYRGELHVCLANHTDRQIEFPAGSKIAQIVFLKYNTFDIVSIDSSDQLSSTERGEGGFGSTGA
jgi:dUTP pyrophosphatase